MNDNYFMKKPCKHCPYRHDVKLFLTPERGEELAYYAGNEYNSFPCHTPTEHDEDSDGESYSYATEKSLQCHGFMVLQHIETNCDLPEGFEPAYDLIYEDSYAMIDAYENQN